MTYAKGRGVRLEVASTYGSPKTVSEVTEADPPVATSTSHALATKSVGYFSAATGMPRLDGQACRLGTVATNTFELEDLDTTSYGNFTAGTFVPVTAWLTVSNATDINKSGGEGNPLDVSVLLDEIAQEETGLLSAETVSITCRLETISNAAIDVVRAAARSQGYCVFRVTYKDGSVRVFRGQPSLPTESVSTGQVGQSTFTSTVKGLWIEGVA